MRCIKDPRDAPFGIEPITIGAMDAEKPELTLLPGELMFDVDAVVAFYTKLTGKTPTPEEIEQLRVELSRARDADL